MKKLLNFMKNTKLKNAILLIFLLFLYVFISAQSYVTAVSENLSDAVFRLHVLANSDSDADQALKIKVRDELLKYMNSISSNCSTKAEAISVLSRWEAGRFAGYHGFGRFGLYDHIVSV